MKATRMPVPNSTYPKVAVQWLNQALCSFKVSAWLTVKCFEIRHTAKPPTVAAKCKRYNEVKKL